MSAIGEAEFDSVATGGYAVDGLLKRRHHKTMSAPPANRPPMVKPEAKTSFSCRGCPLTRRHQRTMSAPPAENLKVFTQPGTGVRPAKGWGAAAVGKNIYNVAYDFIDGASGEKQAIWSVNTETGQVKYVNEAAKIFSWTPNY